MRGKGVLLALLVMLMICQVPIQVDAGRSSWKPTWTYYGLQLKLLVENNDYWTTESVSELFFIFTLLDEGDIVDFKELTFEITLVTETNYTGEFSVEDPWNVVGDETRIVCQFDLLNEDVNNAGWDIYMASFYYSFEIIVDTETEHNLKLYTNVIKGTPLSISTFKFIVFWPFPPIILMCCVYWGLYFGLKKFNKRYEGLEKIEESNTR
ncbi:MAG: hypothetical protein ACFFBJ_11585 [Promethearchaeota archaeon]